MQIDEILHCFKHPDGVFPTKAVNAALEQQEAITPHLLAILEHTLSNYKHLADDAMDFIFALYLLSKFKEKKAFSYILALASLPEDWPEILLGDCITEDLPSFIISTYNDDLSLIKKLIENTESNDWARASALESLLGLVACHKLSREELIDYLRTLFHSSLVEDEIFTTNLINVATDLYPEELMDEINYVFEKNKVDTLIIDRKWIKQILSQDKDKCLVESLYNNQYYLPIDDVEKAMSWMHAFHPNQAMEYDIWDEGSVFTSDIEPTYIRTTIKIGRNEPCPCGSGKKFKKCCLE